MTKKTDYKKYFELKNQTLLRVKNQLKQDFIGIDNIIDQFFEHLKIWYLTPEVLTRPIIINLWGMTGCGKTDFVRKLCKYLDYQNKLIEIDISSASRAWRGVDGKVKDFGVDHKEPFIIFFDEIQNYRTVDEDGKTENKMERFDDLWQILSDGKISKATHDFNDMYDALWDIESAVKRKEKEDHDDSDDSLFSWANRGFRRMRPYLSYFFNHKNLEDITKKDLASISIEKLQKKLFEPIDYSKALIIISGNLDEAFFDSGMVDEVEIDPDIFHSRSKNINLLDIKKALRKRFKPEQISRFGNNHLIYPSLSKDSFVKIIKKELDFKTTDYKEKYNIEFSFDSDFINLIYSNGVFPTQGVRPLFSTISQITDVTIARFLPEILASDYKKVQFGYKNDLDDSSVTITLCKNKSKKVLKHPFIGQIDKLRKKNNPNQIALIAVHEISHSIVYSYLLQLAPIQIKANLASSGGFIFPHKINLNKDFLQKRIQILLAGHLGEKLIFGSEKVSTGAVEDISLATNLASEYIREYGFDGSLLKAVGTYNSQADIFVNQNGYGNDKIQDLLDINAEKATDILKNHKKLLLELSTKLVKNGYLEINDYIKICKKHGLDVLKKDEDYEITDNYYKILFDSKD